MNSATSPLVRQLETLTRPFRNEKAGEHDAAAAEAHRGYRAQVDAWIDAVCSSGDARGGVAMPPRRVGDAWEPSRALDKFVRMKDATARVSAIDWARAEAERAVTTQKWHDERARGQRFRFRNLEACGVRVRTTTCGTCGYDTRATPVPEGCGVARLCRRCSLFAAKKRRARFGRARARVLTTAPKHLFRKKRIGGAYQERMLTVTIPHVTKTEIAAWIADCERVAADEMRTDFIRAQAERRAGAARDLLAGCKDSVVLRIEALWAAWPRFVRKLVAAWKRAKETIDGGTRGPVRPQIHRAAEWTPGHDGLGHPHFHVWVWSPFLDAKKVARMWTDALLDEGVPPPKTREGLAVVNLKRIYGFNNAMAAELMKGGQREALELSRVHYIDRDAGGVIFTYADGWTIHDVIDVALPEVVASIYEALEGKRLTQASRGFFGDDPAPCCPFCLAVGGPNGWANFVVTFAPRDEARAECTHARAPP